MKHRNSLWHFAAAVLILAFFAGVTYAGLTSLPKYQGAVIADQPPVAMDDSVSGTCMEPILIDVLANDYDINGDPIMIDTFSAISFQGATVENVNNILVYTSLAGFSGTDELSYTIADPAGNIAGALATVTVTCDMEPPLVTQITTDANVLKGMYIDIEISISEPPFSGEYTVDFSPFSLAGNNPVQYISENGTHIFRYFAIQDFSGSDNFTVTVTDSFGNVTQAVITLTVILGDTTPPVAVADSAEVNQGTYVDIEILANDYDTENAPLFVSSVDSVSANGNHLQIIMNDDQVSAVRYFSANGFTGEDSFWYTLMDPAGNTASAKVTVTVKTLCDGGSVLANVNINPGNSAHEFFLKKPDGTQITRDDLFKASHLENDGVFYEGEAMLVKFKPKGNQKNNVLTIDGQGVSLRNSRTYVISGNEMNTVVFNDHVKAGKAMGQWWLVLDGDCASLE